MTPQDLITELERIDATATKGPWTPHTEGKRVSVVSEGAGESICNIKQWALPVDEADAHAIAFLRNHAGKLAEMLKVAVEAIENAPHESCCKTSCWVERALNQLNTIASRP